MSLCIYEIGYIEKVNLDREIAEDILFDLRKMLSKHLRDNSKVIK